MSLIGLKDTTQYSIPDDLRLRQTDFSNVKMMVDELLDLPETNAKVASIQGAVEEPRERVMYDKWITSAVNHASLEASILMYDSVTDISWVPEGPKSKNSLLCLKGQYWIRVKTENGEMVDCEATSDWVETNYPKGILSSLQKAAYQKLEKIETSDTTDERLLTGYIAIEGKGPNFCRCGW